jgi:hypothetical protein
VKFILGIPLTVQRDPPFNMSSNTPATPSDKGNVKVPTLQVDSHVQFIQRLNQVMRDNVCMYTK